MSWLSRYRLREFLRSGLWIPAACALVCAIIVARLLRRIDDWFGWTCFNFTAEGARTILSGFATSMLTFIVVVASSLLLIVQLVSANLTPRIIAITFRHPLIRTSMSMFLFTYSLSIAILGRIEDRVPQFAVAVAIVLDILGLILFLHFVGALGMGLRPIKVLSSAATEARRVIFDVYPMPYDPSAPEDEHSLPANIFGDVQTAIPYEGTSGVLLAFDTQGLVALAAQQRCVIELVPRVGDYVAGGETLFRVYGSGSVDPAQLRRMVALGPERTMQQDPRFAFRIIVDIACKALSPAINDPTTAVLAIDQIHRLLRWVGTRKLLSGAQTDASGAVRLIFSTPTWDDFVWHGTAELRLYGGGNMRVCQRLRAMLEHLIQTLPQARQPALQQHLRLLEQAVDRNLADPADRNRVYAGSIQRNGAATDA